MPKEKNGGIRKICGCPRARWVKCSHPWHFSFMWKGEPYRFSLNKQLNKVTLSRSEAERAAETLRTQIREGKLIVTSTPEPALPQPEQIVTFDQFAEEWKKLKGYQLVRPEDNTYRLNTIGNFVLPSGAKFGKLDVRKITSDHIERFRTARKAAGLSVVTINHDLKLLRKMFNWGIRARREAERIGHEIPAHGLTHTPFRDGGVALISLEKETPRARRFDSEEDEERLLSLADPRMRAFITTMLDTCCRPGELRTLQWREVNLRAKEMTILPGKSKTRVGGEVPLSSRVVALLEMRQYLPDGNPMPPDKYVFGDEVGEQMSKNVLRNAWERLRDAAADLYRKTNGEKGVDLKGLRLADLRHEAASRYDELDVPTAQISKLLRHANLSTTTRYVNPSKKALRRAVNKIEDRFARSLQGAETATLAAEKNPAESISPSTSQTVA